MKHRPHQKNKKTLSKKGLIQVVREVLDEIDPKALRKTFLSVFHEAQRGKLLERYSFLDGYLCLVDGTELFNSGKIHCKSCQKQNNRPLFSSGLSC